MTTKKAASKPKVKVSTSGSVALADEKGGTLALAVGRTLKRGAGGWGTDKKITSSNFRPGERVSKRSDGKKKRGHWLRPDEKYTKPRPAVKGQRTELTRVDGKWIEAEPA